MLREGQTREPGHPPGYVWASGKPFYGTRVCPGYVQGLSRVPPDQREGGAGGESYSGGL